MEPLDFTIEFKGKTRRYTASLYRYGYTFRIQVDIEEHQVYFEPDEEGQFRALFEENSTKVSPPLDGELVKAIAAELQAALG